MNSRRKFLTQAGLAALAAATLAQLDGAALDDLFVE